MDSSRLPFGSKFFRHLPVRRDAENDGVKGRDKATAEAMVDDQNGSLAGNDFMGHLKADQNAQIRVSLHLSLTVQTPTRREITVLDHNQTSGKFPAV